MKRALGHLMTMLAALIPALTLWLAPVHSTMADTVKKSALDALAVMSKAAAPADFSAFLASVAKTEPALVQAAAAYAAKAPLRGDDLINIGRLLGLYNRLRNQAACIDTIGKMVALRTVRDEKVPQHENPAVIAFGMLVEALAKDFGLVYRNVENRVFEVSLPGSGTEAFGILTHADVVPAVADEWVLNGTPLDPFKLTRIGDNLYGRGTIDDKGSIAAALYAMKTVKESGVPLTRTIRLMIDTTEETGGDAFKYYRERNALPEFNIVLDSKYPAVVAEKGSGALKVTFPVQVAGKQPAIMAMSGAAAANTVPQTATARIAGGDPIVVATALEAARAAFIHEYEPQGGPFSIDVVRSVDGIDVKVTGTSAHGSRPEEGVNPLPRLALFLLASGVDLADNHYLKAAKYLKDLYGTGYLGEKMGIGYRDDFMGPLTISPNLARERDQRVEVIANVRMPRGSTPEALKDKIAERINGWAAANQVSVEINHEQDNWMARDPKGAWLATLLNIFGDTTGLPASPVTTAGSTTAKLLPNAINFGPAMPGKKYTAHNANEYKEVADLDLDMQMFTEMLVRIGNLDRMQ